MMAKRSVAFLFFALFAALFSLHWAHGYLTKPNGEALFTGSFGNESYAAKLSRQNDVGRNPSTKGLGAIPRADDLRLTQPAASAHVLSSLARAKAAVEWAGFAVLRLTLAFFAAAAGLACLAFVTKELRSRKVSNP
jgi:hypothetical protein